MKLKGCTYCRKIIWFFPIIPQGKNTKYHKNCLHKYMGLSLGFAMELSMKTKANKNILIKL